MTGASLLPGLREIRAALVSGYVYLFALALAVADHVPDQKHATGVFRTLWRLHDAASPIGVGIAVSVVAYLVGSIVEAAFTLIDGRRQFGKVPGQQLDPRGFDMLREVTGEIVAEIRRRLARRGHSLNTARSERVLPPDSSLARSLTEASRLAPDLHPLTSDGDAEESLEDGLRIVISSMILKRLNVLPIRLLGEDPELFDSLDRLKSESELRRSLVPALIACAVVLAFRASAVWLIAFGPIALLWEQSKLRRRQSDDQAIEALLLGRLNFPELERLKTEAQEAEE